MNIKPIDYINWDDCPMCELWVKPAHHEIPSRSYYKCSLVKSKPMATEPCNIIDYQFCPLARQDMPNIVGNAEK